MNEIIAKNSLGCWIKTKFDTARFVSWYKYDEMATKKGRNK